MSYVQICDPIAAADDLLDRAPVEGTRSQSMPTPDLARRSPSAAPAANPGRRCRSGIARNRNRRVPSERTWRRDRSLARPRPPSGSCRWDRSSAARARRDRSERGRPGKARTRCARRISGFRCRTSRVSELPSGDLQLMTFTAPRRREVDGRTDRILADDVVVNGLAAFHDRGCGGIGERPQVARLGQHAAAPFRRRPRRGHERRVAGRRLQRESRRDTAWPTAD